MWDFIFLTNQMTMTTSEVVVEGSYVKKLSQYTALECEQKLSSQNNISAAGIFFSLSTSGRFLYQQI